jgi:RimJ/RimL family protein N-acetyltransferase
MVRAVASSLIEMQLDVLFARDARGRLVATRDPEPRLAPRVFLGRSAEGNVWAVRTDVDAATCAAIERLCAAEPVMGMFREDAGPRCRDGVIELLSQCAPIEAEWRGPAFVLPVDPPDDARAREASFASEAAWRPVFPWLGEHFEALAPVVIAFDGGQPAAVCHAPRGCTASAAEAGVETLAAHRGRGLATAAVACWARAVQRSGRVALYSTSWENAASRAVARRLSARLYGEDWHVR